MLNDEPLNKFLWFTSLTGYRKLDRSRSVERKEEVVCSHPEYFGKFCGIFTSAEYAYRESVVSHIL